MATRHYESTETRRRQIAEAALHVIAEGGLRQFTTRAIALRVGITDGTIFRHFADKQEVVHAALDLLEEEMFGQDHPDLPPLERFEDFFKRRAKAMGARGSYGRLLFSEQMVHVAGETGRKRISGWRARNVAIVAGCLRELHQAGRLATPLPPEALLPLVQGVLLTFALHANLAGDAPDPTLDARVDQAWNTLRTLIVR